MSDPRYVLDRDGDIWKLGVRDRWRCLTSEQIQDCTYEELAKWASPLTELVPAGAGNSTEQPAEMIRRLRLDATEWPLRYAHTGWGGLRWAEDVLRSAPVVPPTEPTDEYKPGRWWRAVAPNGSVWCESSSEREVRRAMRTCDVLQRVHELHKFEWRVAPTEPDGPTRDDGV